MATSRYSELTSGFEFASDMIELGFLLLRYFCLLLRFFLFFNKTKLTMDEVKRSKGITLNDFSHFRKKKDDTYDQLRQEERSHLEFADLGS